MLPRVKLQRDKIPSTTQKKKDNKASQLEWEPRPRMAQMRIKKTPQDFTCDAIKGELSIPLFLWLQN